MKDVLKDFYAYTVSFTALASGASATGSINIEADSSFVAVKLSYSADIAAAAQTDSSRVIPLVTLQLTDTGSGRNLINQATPIPNLFGTGQIPFILPIAREFKANSTLNFAVTNYDAASTYNLYLTLSGQKIFKLTR